jgi:hypothetical protein
MLLALVPQVCKPLSAGLATYLRSYPKSTQYESMSKILRWFRYTLKFEKHTRSEDRERCTNLKVSYKRQKVRVNIWI